MHVLTKRKGVYCPELLMFGESTKIKKLGLLDTILALLHQGLMSYVYKNVN